MSKEYSFSVMPSVSISRSRFLRKSQHKTSFNLGDIIPIYVDEVLPGDTRSIDVAHLVRMSTPIAPIMDNIYLDFYAFFVPNRLVWDHWKEFMGENNTSAGIPSQSYSIPKCVAANSSASFASGSLGDYFGLPLGVGIAKDVSVLPFRAYALIYNEWFRNQNVIAPLAIYKGDGYGALVGQTLPSIQKAAKLADYFTKCLPYAQKGAPVKIPLGSTAPVGVINQGGTLGNDYITDFSVEPASSTGFVGLNSVSDDGAIDDRALVVDLSTATAATINQLRYAFQLQKLLEKDALYGSRYWEILASHFGVTAPDASLQRPEY